MAEFSWSATELSLDGGPGLRGDASEVRVRGTSDTRIVMTQHRGASLLNFVLGWGRSRFRALCGGGAELPGQLVKLLRNVISSLAFRHVCNRMKEQFVEPAHQHRIGLVTFEIPQETDFT